MSKFLGLHSITLGRSGSLAHTVRSRVRSARDIHSVSFTPEDVYATQPEKRRRSVEDAFAYCKKCGADAAGAHKLEIWGGYHRGTGRDTFEHTTGILFDKDGGRIYLHRAFDNTYWDRLHIPSDTDDNKQLWDRLDDYPRSTEAEYKVYAKDKQTQKKKEKNRAKKAKRAEENKAKKEERLCTRVSQRCINERAGRFGHDTTVGPPELWV